MASALRRSDTYSEPPTAIPTREFPDFPFPERREISQAHPDRPLPFPDPGISRSKNISRISLVFLFFSVMLGKFPAPSGRSRSRSRFSQPFPFPGNSRPVLPRHGKTGREWILCDLINH